MFTGIVRHVGQIRQILPGADGKRLTIDLGPLAEGLVTGDSVAVAGACLTVTAVRRTEADFDVVPETLTSTTLGGLRVGQRVNLERPLRLADALDGHLVQGHVDGVAEVREIRTAGGHVVRFAAPRKLTDQMIPKGSVCVDGVSLTLLDLNQGQFAVALIPATLAETTLGALAVGSKVNVETDVIGKYVRRYLRQTHQVPSEGLTLEKLQEAGFI